MGRTLIKHTGKRHLVMCPPEYYEITGDNPWTPPGAKTDRDAAMAEWEKLRGVYERLGHEVRLIEPHEDLTQMVFAANGAVAIDGKAFVARPHSEERAGEGPVHAEWFRNAGYDVRVSKARSEGEGDFLVTERFILAGTGFRTDQSAHFEAQEFFSRPVMSLQLVHEKFYHLDTAVCVLDERNIAYYPGAFSEGSRLLLERVFPDAVIANDDDANQLGLNALSDGENVIIHSSAEHLAAELDKRGYNPIGIDMPQLQMGGGGPKCCTMGLYEAKEAP
ncbi:dimethylargininase [Spirillospora sp. CA-253888]